MYSFKFNFIKIKKQSIGFSYGAFIVSFPLIGSHLLPVLHHPAYPCSHCNLPTPVWLPRMFISYVFYFSLQLPPLVLHFLFHGPKFLDLSP